MSRTVPVSHPRMPLYVLIDTLARQGWGALAGARYRGVQGVLEGLCSLLPYGSASGRVTVEQIASASQYSHRWTRVCLTVLEDMDLITWQRGGVRYGRPVPSVITVSKTMLCELIAGARAQRTAQIIENKLRDQRRLANICSIRFVMGRRKPTPDALTTPPSRRDNPQPHVAVTAYPSPPRREDRRASALQAGNSATQGGSKIARAALAALGINVPSHHRTRLASVVNRQ